MIKNDYIIRMIEQLGDILRKVLTLEEKGEFKESHDEIDTAMKQLGVSRLLARTMPTDELVRFACRPGGDNVDRCVLLSRLIGADAHIYVTEGKRDVAHTLYVTSLGILTEIMDEAEDEKLEQIKKDIDGLRLCIGENIREDNSSLDV
jgi:hypothetical protein